MAQFQLVVRTGPNAGRSYPLEAAEVIIGRDVSNAISINDAEISRKHCKLTLHGNTYVVEDLGSTNGTFVNNQRLTSSKVLNPGDNLSLGENISMLYEAAMDPNATVVSSAKAPRTVAPVKKAEAPAAPAYSGQVPAGPAPAAKPARKGGSKVVLIVIIAVVLCLILGCILTFVWVDADATGARWCMFPFNLIGRMLGGVCQ
jgi:predicted component of type VI protein secretion system